MNRRDGDRRRLVGIPLARIEVAARHDDAFGDLFDRQQLAVRFLGLAVGRDGPRDHLFPEILRHPHSKHPALSPREEVRRLTAIRAARFNEVAGAGRYRELFLPVPVEVPEHHVEAAIRIANPPLEVRHDVLTTGPFRLRNGGRELLRAHLLDREGRDDDEECEKRGSTSRDMRFSLSTGWGCSPFDKLTATLSCVEVSPTGPARADVARLSTS